MLNEIYDLSIEKGIFSAILFNPEVYEDINEVLQAGDFYLPIHKKIFQAMDRLNQKDEPLSEDFIKREMGKDFDEDAMIEIIASTPITNINSYIKELKSKAIKRNLSKLANQIQKDVQENKGNDELLDSIQSSLYLISQDSTSNDFKDSKTVTMDTLALIRKMKERGNSLLAGLDTGFMSLNRKTAGFKDGDLVIIAARPAMGKTSFVLNIALKAVMRNEGVAIFSLEMPAEQLMLRLLSSHTSIPLQNLNVGNLNDTEWNSLTSATDELANKSLFIDDYGALNISQLKSKLRKLKGKYPEIKLVIIDYLQLMSGMGNKDRHLEVSEISRSLKMLSRELALPIVALSQLNRGLEARADKRPMLSDLRESGAIEQDADLIMFVYRDDIYKYKEEQERKKEQEKKGNAYDIKFEFKDEEEAEIIIGKQRNGPTGYVKVKFQKAFTRFVDLEDTDVVYEKEYGNTQQTEAKMSVSSNKIDSVKI